VGRDPRNQVESRCQTSWASRLSALNQPAEPEVLDPEVNPPPLAARRAGTRQLIGPHGADSAVPQGDTKDVRGGNGLWQRLHQPAKTGDGGQHPRKGREAFHAATGGRTTTKNEDSSSPVGCAATFLPKLRPANSNRNRLQPQPARTVLG
jgi:hypothetical protein